MKKEKPKEMFIKNETEIHETFLEVDLTSNQQL